MFPIKMHLYAKISIICVCLVYLVEIFVSFFLNLKPSIEEKESLRSMFISFPIAVFGVVYLVNISKIKTHIKQKYFMTFALKKWQVTYFEIRHYFKNTYFLIFIIGSVLHGLITLHDFYDFKGIALLLALMLYFCLFLLSFIFVITLHNFTLSYKTNHHYISLFSVLNIILVVNHMALYQTLKLDISALNPWGALAFLPFINSDSYLSLASILVYLILLIFTYRNQITYL